MSSEVVVCHAYLGDPWFAIVLVDKSWSATVNNRVEDRISFDTIMSDSLGRDHSGLVTHPAEGSASCQNVSDFPASQ